GCNFRCKHCYQDALHALPNELTTHEAEGIMDQLAQAGVAAIAFSGGEPLARPDIDQLVCYAKKCGFLSRSPVTGR
ncbi:MAG: radical SAM protein, partial [Methanomicrobiales archaeon]|nr:radical SAM protein [Methanomicrobiales archaeon]